MEDRKGVPFIGPAGQLLRRVLTEMGYEKRAIYMNTVSCWPTGELNDKPTAEQKRACRLNLKDQLEAVDTPYVLACGQIATQAMIRHATVATMGHLIPIHGKLVYPILHPAYLLYKKDPEIYQRWRTEIAYFLLCMEFGAAPDEVCFYCNGPQYGDLPTCYKHRKDWRSDQIWDQTTRSRGTKGKPLPGQGGMFE